MFHVKHALCALLALTLTLPLPALGVETVPAKTYKEIFEAYPSGRTVERQLEAPDFMVVLMWSDLVGLPETEHVRNYTLALISKESAEPEQQYRPLILPSTVAVKGAYASQYPTDRAPDKMFLNDDGSILTYVYSFEEALFNAGGELLHNAGTYTYRVERFEALEELPGAGEGHLGKLWRSPPARQLVP